MKLASSHLVREELHILSMGCIALTGGWSSHIILGCTVFQHYSPHPTLLIIVQKSHCGFQRSYCTHLFNEKVSFPPMIMFHLKIIPLKTSNHLGGNRFP